MDASISIMSCPKIIQIGKEMNITCETEEKTLNWTATLKQTGEVVTLIECPEHNLSCKAPNPWHVTSYADQVKPVLQISKMTDKHLGLKRIQCNVRGLEFEAHGCTEFEFKEARSLEKFMSTIPKCYKAPDDSINSDFIIAAVAAAVAACIIFVIICFLYRRAKRNASGTQESEVEARDDFQERQQVDVIPMTEVNPHADARPSEDLSPEQLMHLENYLYKSGP